MSNTRPYWPGISSQLVNFLTGCPKRSDALRQTGAWDIAHLKQEREQYAMYRRKPHVVTATPMRMKIALAYLLDCFKDYFHKK
jgi:hypothetical protein